jgi:hypothetical protein
VNQIRTYLLILSLIALVSFAPAQQRIELRALTANNTSASDRFRGEPNGNAAPANISKLPLRSLLYPGATTRILVRWMPWFGGGKHADVGYNSDDQNQIRRQVDDMISRGIDAAVVDWYGKEDGFKDRATERLLGEAERRGGSFSVALSVDKGTLKNCGDCTNELIEEMNYAARKYEQSPAYLRFNGRPAVFFFGLEKSNLDWDRVHREAEGRPLLFIRNSGAFRLGYNEGAYSWIAPETVKPGDPLGMEYVERFYNASRSSNKITVGSAYKGFDDSIAGWGKNRQIPQRCGETWLDTFAEAGRFYSSSHQLPALLIPTWNDYEEGTEIETGIGNCVQISASADRGTLRWQISGPERTIDHYEIFAASERDPDDVTRIANVNAGKHSLDVDDLRLAPGNYVLYLEAYGRASIQNHLSSAVRYTQPGRSR